MHDFVSNDLANFLMTRTKGKTVLSEGSIDFVIKEKLDTHSVKIVWQIISFQQIMILKTDNISFLP